MQVTAGAVSKPTNRQGLCRGALAQGAHAVAPVGKDVVAGVSHFASRTSTLTSNIFDGQTLAPKGISVKFPGKNRFRGRFSERKRARGQGY